MLISPPLRTNNVMDKHNRELFAPHGLFCMIMKYEPELKEPKNPSRLKQFASLAVNGSNNGGGSAWMRNHVSGESQGPGGLPTAVAPLVYMENHREHKKYLSDSPPESLDSKMGVVPAGGKISTKDKAKKAFDNFSDYLDRRARATYIAENGNDVLSGPAGRGFSNRYLDPNHPAVNGGLIGLLSGGVLSPTPEQRAQKKAGRIDDEERRVLDEYNDRRERILNDRRSQSETDRELRRLERDYEPRLEQFRKKRRALEGGNRSIKNVSLTHVSSFLLTWWCCFFDLPWPFAEHFVPDDCQPSFRGHSCCCFVDAGAGIWSQCHDGDDVTSSVLNFHSVYIPMSFPQRRIADVMRRIS